MFGKVNQSLKYDSNILLVHKYIYIYMDTNTDHFTPLALRVQGNKMKRTTSEEECNHLKKQYDPFLAYFLSFSNTYLYLIQRFFVLFCF